MSPIERYRNGQLVERISFVPIVSVTAALAFGAVAYLTPILQQPTTRPTVTVAEAGGGPDSVYWFADFSYALGDSQAALYSGPTGGNQKFDTGSGTNGVLDVVSASGLDFPAAMSNVLRVQAVGTGAGQHLTNDALDSVPQNGSRYFRFYIRVDGGANDSQTAHGIEEIAESWTHLQWTSAMLAGYCSPSSSQWCSGMQPDGIVYTTSTPLWRDSTYRMEFQLRRTTDTTFTMHARTYILRSGTEVLLYDDDDFHNTFFGGTFLTDSIDRDIRSSNGLMTSLEVGVNGIEPTFTGTFMWQGGFAQCSDWCGPYPIAGVEN